MQPRYVKATKRYTKTQKTGKLGREEGVLELAILGEPGTRIISLTESGIQSPRTRIIPLTEFGIYYQTEPRASGREV